MDNYQSIREEAFEANLEIPKRNLAIYTWGNVSAFDPERGVFAIKPSGVDYERLTPSSMVVVDLDGKIVDGTLNPSSDTETHRILYRAFSGGVIRGITHTHSPYATSWAQARRPVPVFGTTHADYAAESIPCTAYVSEEAVHNNYERETGNLIVETFRREKRDLLSMPMALVAGHGPFTWGASAREAVYHAAVLEEICKIGVFTLLLNPGAEALPPHIIQKHWERKHGPGASYGQRP
ncbi:MAG: L-ribulose-5-phosphate 4-epimerase AraD [Treponema sp.]|jgi:L-ribulose-5-phosphate 4-epimerase|nr:L-ribulose-5-phosphate 4-epimerase AraD [Treponema sp.]